MTKTLWVVQDLVKWQAGADLKASHHGPASSATVPEYPLYAILLQLCKLTGSLIHCCKHHRFNKTTSKSVWVLSL